MLSIGKRCRMRLSPAGELLTRRVSQIVEYHLGGLAQLNVSVRRFTKLCNYSEQRAVDLFQSDARLVIQLWVMLLDFSRQRRLPPSVSHEHLHRSTHRPTEIGNSPTWIGRITAACFSRNQRTKLDPSDP
jgi:hypothetical protein